MRIFFWSITTDNDLCTSALIDRNKLDLVPSCFKANTETFILCHKLFSIDLKEACSEKLSRIPLVTLSALCRFLRLIHMNK